MMPGDAGSAWGRRDSRRSVYVGWRELDFAGPTTWEKARAIIAAQGGGVTVDLMKQVLLSVVKSKLEL
jgi:hypothetical protein